MKTLVGDSYSRGLRNLIIHLTHNPFFPNKDGDHILRYPFDIGDFIMTSISKAKATADDLKVEAEQAFQRVSVQQKQNGDDFDFEFESAFQSDPSSLTSQEATKSTSFVTKDAAGRPDISNGPSQFSVETEGLPSSVPSSQG